MFYSGEKKRGLNFREKKVFFFSSLEVFYSHDKEEKKKLNFRKCSFFLFFPFLKKKNEYN